MTAATLEPPRTAVLVVDLQEKLLPVIPEREAIVRNTALLLRLARTLALPAILTTQYRKGLGPVVPEILAVATDRAPLDKTTFGCFGSREFCDALGRLPERTHLVVSGIETHVCVAQTVLAALDRGLVVHVASDAVGSRRAADHEVGLRRMERAGAVLSSTEMAIYELLGDSDSAAFKTMRPFLKG